MDFPSATVQQALNSLASCIRCRERRVGCDRLLPSCQACAAISADCELYDHVLDAKFPRSYLQQLYLRLQHLEQLEARLQPQQQQQQQQHHRQHPSQRRLHQVPSLPSLKSSSSLSDHSPSPAAESSYSAAAAAHHSAPLEQHPGERDIRGEWGPSSALAHLRLVTTLLNIDLTRPLYQALSFKVDVPLTQSQPSFLTVPQLNPPRAPLPPRETAQFLLEFYYNSIDSFIPVLGRKLGDQDLEQLYTDCSQRQNMRACTRAQLALAVAARCLFRSAATKGTPTQSQAYLQLSDSMFESASSTLKTVLSDSTQLLDVVSPSAFENEEAHAMAKLQIVLLQVCYVLCAPQKGNVWQLLGFAERLWRNMQNARAQLRRSNSPDGHLVREQARHRPEPNLLYCSFVLLERMIGTAYGRPIDFLDFAEADEPTHRPDDKSVAALYTTILELKQSVHSAFLSGKQEPGGVLGPEPGTPKSGSVDWYHGVKRQAEAWYEQWQDAIDFMTRDASPIDGSETRRIADGKKQFWLSTGRKWRDESLHLAYTLLLQTTPSPASTPASGKFPAIRQLSPELLTEGRNIVRRLVNAYVYLLRQPFTLTHQGSQIPLVFPRLWIFDLEVFRTAVTAAYLSHQQDAHSSDDSNLTWEVANCIKLLSSTSSEVDAEGLCEAILALIEVRRNAQQSGLIPSSSRTCSSFLDDLHGVVYAICRICLQCGLLANGSTPVYLRHPFPSPSHLLHRETCIYGIAWTALASALSCLYVFFFRRGCLLCFDICIQRIIVQRGTAEHCLNLGSGSLFPIFITCLLLTGVLLFLFSQSALVASNFFF